jgi:hypothetical protein
VLRGLFLVSPTAVVTTTLARYTADTFEDVYPDTAWRNIGSMFAPATMPELCNGPCQYQAR